MVVDRVEIVRQYTVIGIKRVVWFGASPHLSRVCLLAIIQLVLCVLVCTQVDQMERITIVARHDFLIAATEREVALWGLDLEQVTELACYVLVDWQRLNWLAIVAHVPDFD